MSSPNEPVSAPTKPPGSLRSELLIGQLSVLLIVVLGFGGAIYGLMRQAIYREAESDLLGAAQLIAQDVGDVEPSAVTIARAYRHRFGPAPRDHAYFAIWDAAGKSIAASDPLPPHVVPLANLPPADGPRPFDARTHGGDLEVIVRGPQNSQVLVGRPLAKEGDRLHALLRNLMLGGAIALALGGVACWRLANRIVRPIEQLTDAAERISAKRLDQRLQLAPASAELHRLADVFNGMLERLQTSFEQQIRFTADASHELRTPVAVILTQTDHTLSRPRSNDEYCQALDACRRAARRMKRLVDDLLLLARADAGRLASAPERCDLAEVARATLEMLAPLARDRDVRLESQLQPTLVLGDAAQLSQVVANLVTNAIRHSPAAGQVFVSVNPRQQRALLMVADGGDGIPIEDQPRLFERFYQADKARSHQEGQGAGLGLSIVAEIVALHDGTVDVASTINRGSAFTVDFPLIPEP